MDPFSSESELLPLHNAFHQGQYTTLTTPPNLSPENALAARVYTLRARIASGDAAGVVAELEAEGAQEPELVAVKAWGLYTIGKQQDAVQMLDALDGTAAAVLVLKGAVLVLEGRAEEAIAVLKGHVGGLEAVALIVQIRLLQNRTDLALKEVQVAKKWAQDSLLVNLAESWVGLRIGGEKYQQAYYVFEELAQAPSTSSTRTLIGQAVSELHLGRLPEAEVALQQALEKNPKDPDALANMIVLSILAGKGNEEYLEELQKVQPKHLFLVDLAVKSEAFDKAAAKYSVKAGA